MRTPRKSTPAARAAADRAKGGRVSEPGPVEWLLAARLALLLRELGNNRLAGLLDVSPSQPSRWKSGEERIGAENQRRLIDLDYVMARLLRLYPRAQAEIWLTSHNVHLGSRPVDVLRLRGAAPVVQAIDAEAEGAYA